MTFRSDLNPVPFILWAVIAAAGYLIGGATGALMGIVIWGLLMAAVELIF